MYIRELPIAWRVLLLLGMVAIGGIAATYHRGVFSETGSAVNPSTAAAPRPTPEQCVSDPESVACLKARIDQLEVALGNHRIYLRGLDTADRDHENRIRELHDQNQRRTAEGIRVQGEVSELKRKIGEPGDDPENKIGDFDNVWMAINGVKKRLTRAGH